MHAWIDLGLILVAITFFCTIIWNVEVGVICSIIFSLLLVVHKSSKPRITILVSPLLSFDLICVQDVHREGVSAWDI